MMEKVIRNGEVAVLVSGGYGAGWYSWNQDYPELLFHPELVALVESEESKTDEGQDKAEEICKRITNNEYFYAGGFEQCRIEWLPIGTAFYIDEYDGAESLITEDKRVLVA